MIVGNAAFIRVSGRFCLLDAPCVSPTRCRLQSGRIRHAAMLHAQCLDHFSGTAHGIAYTGRWHVDTARPLTLAAVVHLADRQPLALKLQQLSGQVVDVGAA